MKTIEEIKNAVIAYCEEVCPNQGDRKYFDWGYIYRWNDSWSLSHILDGSCIFMTGEKNEYPRLQNWHLAYAILGLEARDAKAEWNEATAKAIAHLNLETAKAERDKLQAESRNAALVEALQSMKNQYGYRYTYGDGFSNVVEKKVSPLGMMIDLALAANTEKGGANNA